MDYDSEYEPPEQEEFEPPMPLQQEARKRSTKGKATKSAGPQAIVWNEANTLILVGLVQKHKAYKKTEKTLADKWTAVTAELFMHENFKSFKVCSSNSIDQKFGRLSKDVEQKYSLDGEGANLSGLLETAPESDQIIYAMLSEVAQTQKEKEAKTKKEAERQTSMLVHEANILDAFSPDATGTKKRKSSPSSAYSESSSGREEDFEDNFLQLMRMPPPQVQLSDIEIEERRAKIAREDAESQARIAQMNAISGMMLTLAEALNKK